jgi:hypothetical protein
MMQYRMPRYCAKAVKNGYARRQAWRLQSKVKSDGFLLSIVRNVSPVQKTLNTVINIFESKAR